MMAAFEEYLPKVIDIAEAAGNAIMQVYSTYFKITKKEDQSPLTQADIAAHHVILHGLQALTPHIPVISEEAAIASYDSRRHWSRYWLIDPLDGTREFVKRNGEFTVNIALIEQHEPVLGVVYAPATAQLYFAAEAFGAHKRSSSDEVVNLQVKPFDIRQLVIAGSRSHSDEKTQQFLHNIHRRHDAKPELLSVGSSLKICLVAEGVADVYPRLGPTFEWDTAAAHCVLREAGGDIVDTKGLSLRYNRQESLLNPHFFATNHPQHPWETYIQNIK
jgi:3'(2'), 5'-bisphosphate nucleotidase